MIQACVNKIGATSQYPVLQQQTWVRTHTLEGQGLAPRALGNDSPPLAASPVSRNACSPFAATTAWTEHGHRRVSMH